MFVLSVRAIGIAAAVLLVAQAALALSLANKCEVAKLKVAGKYGFCRLKAEAKAVKTGDPVDYSKCDEKFADKWGTAETNGGGMCPTSQDRGLIQAAITDHADDLRSVLHGARFVDNGDGTVSDRLTGLMWEKKTNLDGTPNPSGKHDADNSYSWSDSETDPDGSAFTDFLAELNGCESVDGRHCDWRLPTTAELLTIVDNAAPGCGGGGPCIDQTIFGPTQASEYWSSMSWVDPFGVPSNAWVVHFDSGSPQPIPKTVNGGYVRAVRGGS